MTKKETFTAHLRFMSGHLDVAVVSQSETAAGKHLIFQLEVRIEVLMVSKSSLQPSP